MAKKRKSLPELSPAQQEIMECIWQHGELSASEVRTILKPKRQVARNTVRTLLERMEEKGWLKHREEGRTYLYCAAQAKQTTVGGKIAEIVERVCGGSPETLMAALIDFRGLTKDELSRIRLMLDQAQSRGTSKPGD
ncbi:MAG TPA: BlaI/MecI/CopY family transcriptional regulator [Pirellulales bacterium]|jgi:predicted transcriptional regulator|nr:BlaI/MecI/CopY family transcriptional regulator [Pirellulales bacterium]